MTQIASASGSAHPTSEGKKRIGLSMYAKGKAFLAAYLLLHQKASSEPWDYVALQNLCQGIEITLKGLLLLRDYDCYTLQLKPMGHDLVKVVAAALGAYGLRPLSFFR